MASLNYIRIKTTNNVHNIPFGPEHNAVSNSLKKTENNFLHNNKLPIQNKINYHRPDLYKSFGNSSLPYIVKKNSANTFVNNYNGVPQNKLHSFTKENFTKDLDNNEELIYKNFKPCGCPYKSSMPKLRKNLTIFENYENGINTSKNNYFSDKHFTRNFDGLNTTKAFRFSNDGKIIYTLKTFNGNNENKTNKNCCRFYNSCFCFRSKPNKRFHKAQIFNFYKPFLVDDFQEFPD